MVITSSTSSTPPPAAADLSGINKEVAALIEQIKLNRSGSVRQFEKTTNDVRVDNNLTARDIGTLRKNDSRLNLFSALSKGDAVDVFRFKVSTASDTKLGTLIANPADKEKMRIQVFAKSSSRLIADTDPKSGDAYTNFKALEDGKLNLAQGEYVLRISRLGSENIRSQNDIQYAVQLSQGIYKNDYDTIEKTASSRQDQFGFPINLGGGTSQLLSGLSAGYSFISKLPKIGTSATSKLAGSLIDALF